LWIISSGLPKKIWAVSDAITPDTIIYTTLDPLVQATAEEAVINGLEEIEQTAFPSNEPLQAALVRRRSVNRRKRSPWFGGRNYEQNKFNRAIDAKRQPGSAFKPLCFCLRRSRTLQEGEVI
jgi:membrane peptidoglycan carboxypeptidase